MKHEHHCGFTGPSLRKIFESAGFSKSSIVDYHKGICPDIEKLDNRPDISVFVEPVK